MARTNREIAIEEMLQTVEEAMSQVINWWGDLPPPMKEASTPNSDRKGFPQTAMSALPPKADMCSALAHVCFGPIADIMRLKFNGRFTPQK